MIAGKRARKRPLIRSAAISAVVARNLSAVDGLVRRHQDKTNARQEEAFSIQKQYSSAKPLSESMKYLQQLSTLQAAGVLTEEEVQAAKRRLFGS